MFFSVSMRLEDYLTQMLQNHGERSVSRIHEWPNPKRSGLSTSNVVRGPVVNVINLTAIGSHRTSPHRCMQKTVDYAENKFSWYQFSSLQSSESSWITCVSIDK